MKDMEKLYSDRCPGQREKDGKDKRRLNFKSIDGLDDKILVWSVR